MSYTRLDFGNDLLKRLEVTNDPVILARWAYLQYVDHLRELEPGLKGSIMQVVAMEEGPEFEMSKEQLYEFVQKLRENR